MKKVILYKILVLAFCAFLEIFISCNMTDKDAPVYTEKINNIDEKDKAAIIKSYTEGIYDVSFADSLKLYAVNTAARKAIFDLADFYSDLNGHLRSLAMDKKIQLDRAAEIEAGSTINNLQAGKSDFDKAAINEAVVRIQDKVKMFNKYAGEVTDADTKNYFTTAIPLMQKQAKELESLAAQIN